MNIHVADNAREAARMLLRNMLAAIRQPSGAGVKATWSMLPSQEAVHRLSCLMCG